MSYPPGLHEYSDEELMAELNRRQTLRAVGRCSYCQRPFGTDHPCRLHEYQTGMAGGRVLVAHARSDE